jgi:hypothetical protein
MNAQARLQSSKWITDALPDSEMTVLMRCAGDEFPVWPGFHDGEQWCSADGTTIEETMVLGWMEFETAAKILDEFREPLNARTDPRRDRDHE